jgi:hypothetical protein
MPNGIRHYNPFHVCIPGSGCDYGWPITRGTCILIDNVQIYCKSSILHCIYS